MHKLSRLVLIELIWLSASLIFTFLLSLFLFGRNFLSDTIDIHLHDTMFVFVPFQIGLPIFFLVTLIVYFVKEFRHAFRRSLPNWILIIIGLALVIALTYGIKMLSQLLHDGWTIYPPLSALGPDKVGGMPEEDVALEFIINFLSVIQVLVLIVLLYVAFKWGIQKGKEK